ncbi:hypothetical protein F5Y00DRAFT_172136 [Daldinia vernicosa]|uniref:uncharacterized protein n=1 Tax=Daldinia vernicosa TaxID=114800 RepID=UPI0020083B1D|nr:uncharacterized protein F5Y00DRAFT_172136 [Daldinia vernicosa]KAI0845218.1 hypothetical protein F5Y00DRAFT_172136 [Daldinia vernicosa]
MGVMYGEVSQNDNDDDDRNGGASPSTPFSLVRSSSPMPFLPTIESTFTPLSMDSDTYSRIGAGAENEDRDVSGNNSQGRNSHNKLAASTATTRTRAGMSIGDMVQSLTPARATRNNRNEYGLLSPDTAFSSPSSSPRPDDIGSNNPDSSNNNISSEKKSASNHAETVHSSSKGTNDASTRESLVNKKLFQHQQQEPPQPIILQPKPIVRTASTKSVSLRHPTPDLNPRTSSYANNIAQLEATAEKLSMTSSIEDAIRDLHDEQKRNESRRSSILAVSIGSIPENNEPVSFPAIKPLSTTSSILDTNSAARYGGYSPAGFMMSSDPSLVSNPTRMRSGSGPLSRPESEVGNAMSRHGPGKTSTRSVKSVSKPTLTDIAEMEPTTLTPAAMDEADKLAEEPADETLRIPHMEDIDLTPNAEQFGMSSSYDYWSHGVTETQEAYTNSADDIRPPTAGSNGTYEQAERAFADFDGAHCPSEVDLEESFFMPSFSNGPSMDAPFLRPFDPAPSRMQEEPGYSKPTISRPIAPPTVRPKSYMDPETGQTMLYYPARVPLMLNLPQKLSKKPKAEAREARRSQVLSKMSESDRKAGTLWLPEYLPEPPLEPVDPTADSFVPVPLTSSDADPQTQPGTNGQRDSQPPPQSGYGQGYDEVHGPRTSTLDPDKRKSKIPNLDGLPPQLRASAFFDLPSEPSPTIQLKDGSAMATLDSILDASAKAPVSAFTDHAFAGTLGSEVYGTEKKRKSHIKRASATDLLEPKKRSSFLHLRKLSALSRHSESQEERQNTIAGGTKINEGLDAKAEDEERERLAGSIDGEAVPNHADEDGEGDEELVYNGPPTTLLAELQMRKRQQKLRTRPAATAFPNGLHSTLLEIDTVAQIESDARKGKKVNLAWEDPSADPAANSDDEDTPLGLLMAVKGQGNDITAAIAEINRPLGLMEQRELEDNEPLSQRRDRLQGREIGSMKRQSVMTLSQSLHNKSNSLRAASPQLRLHTPEEEEVEGETLGERMRRLRSREQTDNPLPQARPVSSAFSMELLGHLGEAFKEDESDDKGQDKRKSQLKEEEETLGQRRRRLQAEREAREQGTASNLLLSGEVGNAEKLRNRHSLADVLGTRGSKTLLRDPRAEAEKAKKQEAARYRQDQEQKMAILRGQMPSSLSTPNLNQPGGYMSGRFNDGTGGGTGYARTSTALGVYPNQSMGASGGKMGGNYLAGATMSGAIPPYGIANGLGAKVSTPYGMQIQPPAQMDRVERWRQSVLP